MMAKPWRSRSMTSIFNTSRENPKMHIWCKFGDSISIIHYKLSRRQAKFPRILSQDGQNDFEGQGQWPPFSIPAERIPGCMFGVNLVILAQIYDELSCRQVKFPRILCQNGQNDLEGHGQWPPFSIPAERIPGCMFGAKLVILAQIYDELSWGEAKFPRILSQNGKNDLEGQGHDLHFQYQPRVSQDACLVQLWWLVIGDKLSCRQGKVYGRTDVRRQRQYPWMFGRKSTIYK